MRVMVIEDDAIIREGLVQLFRLEGHHAISATDGLDALSTLDCLPAAGLPHVILLDMMMPRMDGRAFRLVQQLDPRYSGIPVAALTEDHPAHRLARGFGFDAVLIKPVDFDTVLAAARFIASGHCLPLPH